MTFKKHSANNKHKSIFHKYRILHRPDKTLPAVKTDNEIEAEGIARLSLDLASLNITDEQHHNDMTESPQELPSQQQPESPKYKPRPKYPHPGIHARHSIGFDVPGAVQTILTPRKKKKKSSFMHIKFSYAVCRINE